MRNNGSQNRDRNDGLFRQLEAKIGSRLKVQVKQGLERTNLAMITMGMKLSIIALRLVRFVCVVSVVKEIEGNLIELEAERQHANQCSI